METKQMMPFDKGIFFNRLKARHMTCNDLINHPSVTITRTKLNYCQKTGTIEKEYYDQIEAALSDLNYRGCKSYTGTKYYGSFVDFGTMEYDKLNKRCKNVGTCLTNVISLEHVSPQTIHHYKKERHIPSDLLEKINNRIRLIQKEKDSKLIEEEKPVKTEPEVKVEPTETVKSNTKVLNSDYKKISSKLKTVVHCNGEANLNFSNITERYECDLETFVNSVFSLVSSEGYVIFTTYNNDKPVFSLGEPM